LKGSVFFGFGCIDRSAALGSGLCPGDDGVDFFLGEGSFVFEESVLFGCGVPGGHFACFDGEGHCFCPGACFVVGAEGHGCDHSTEICAVFAVADLAVFLDDGEDVLVEGDLF
jgi:hypothetical protein